MISDFVVIEETMQLLANNQESILRAWVERLSKDSRVASQKINSEESHRFGKSLVEALLSTITSKDIQLAPASSTMDLLRQMLSSFSLRWEQRGFTPFETAAAVSIFKEVWLMQIQSEYKNNSSALREQTLAVTALMDTLSLMTFDSLVKRREDVISRQAREFMEVSTPVIHLWDGLICVPLIGTLDSQRTQQVMEQLLQRVVDTSSDVAIIDITGVPMIDTQTARHLIETITSVKLLGAQVILTGIRPEIAQTIVHLGIDLSDILCRANMSGGLRLAFEMLGQQVVRRDQV